MGKHIMKNGNLVKINKKFSDLSMRQQEFVRETLKAAHMQYDNIGLKQKQFNEMVLLSVQEILDDRGLWLPLSELKKTYFSCKQKWGYTKS